MLIRIEIYSEIHIINKIMQRITIHNHIYSGPFKTKTGYKLVFEYYPELDISDIIKLFSQQITIIQTIDPVKKVVEHCLDETTGKILPYNEIKGKIFQLKKRGYYSLQKVRHNLYNEMHQLQHQMNYYPQSNTTANKDQLIDLVEQIKTINVKLEEIKENKSDSICDCGGKLIIRNNNIKCKNCGHIFDR